MEHKRSTVDTLDAVIRNTGGGDQSGVRDRNARVILTLIRRNGAMASAEIARRSGLSAQTVSNIMRALEADGLVTREKAVRGKVGKPSVPMALDADGAHSFGLNIGRRSAELALVDFKGKRLAEHAITYPYPTPDNVFPFLRGTMDEVLKASPRSRHRLAGIGVSMPNRLWEWHKVVKAPEEALNAWRSIDVQREVENVSGLEAVMQNDATSACVAEHLLGRGDALSDFVYLFVGAFIGGGLVLNGRVVNGRTGNAAAFGPLPVPTPDGGTTQLLNVASLHTLETALSEAGKDPEILRRPKSDWAMCGGILNDWIAQTGRNLAIASAAAAAVVEIEAVLVDGAMPADIRARLVDTMQHELDAMDMTGVVKPDIVEAAVGRAARSIGAALLPIHRRYFIA